MSSFSVRGCRLSAILMLGVVLFASEDLYANRPVKVDASIKPSKLEQENRFTITVSFAVERGWHTYDRVPEESTSPTTEVQLQSREGVKAVGEWRRPVGLPDLAALETTIYEGNFEFKRDIEVVNGTTGKVDLVVRFQACNDKLCQPPQELKLALAIPADDGSSEPFAKPLMLTVEGKPLNETARQMYPSPAMFDIDGDGQDELIVGDIFGKLNVYENKNQSGKGDPVWASEQTLKSRNGKAIKVSNW